MPISSAASGTWIHPMRANVVTEGIAAVNATAASAAAGPPRRLATSPASRSSTASQKAPASEKTSGVRPKTCIAAARPHSYQPDEATRLSKKETKNPPTVAWSQ
ncbi:MAG: hypothetical protein ACOZNI_16750 [Myxococcota bacterium]